jgi:hypothetical protein
LGLAKTFIASSSHPIRPTPRPVDQPYSTGFRGITDRADPLAGVPEWRTAITSVRPNVDRTKPLSLINWTSYIPQDPDAVCPRKSIHINSPSIHTFQRMQPADRNNLGFVFIEIDY